MKRFLALFLIFGGILAACAAPAATRQPPTLRPTAVATAPLPTPRPTPAPPRPSPTATAPPPPTSAPTATPAEGALGWRFPLRRPIAPPGDSAIAPTYPFGSDYHGLRPLHRGVDMLNPQGTPVLAAADGVVVFAGEDLATPVGPMANFYGQAVVLEHHLPAQAEPVFTLYGHLASIAVRVGRTVRAGQRLGTVGSRGVAIGPHLHFEVRLGANAYTATQNPVLWLQPPQKNQGVLALRLTTPQGQPRPRLAVTVRGLEEDLPIRYPQTYASPTLPGDPRLHENLVLGALPAGRYRLEVTCCGRLWTREVTIRPQRLAFLAWPLP